MNSGEDSLGRQVFKAFQLNDESLYETLQPANEEYQALLQRMLAAKVEGLTQAKIDEMMARRRKEASARFKKDFSELRNEAEQAGVIWIKAVYQSYDNQPVYPEEFHQKYIFGTIWFSVNGTRYLIEDVQAVELPEGYRLQKILRILRVEDIN